jgi:hypothetical protein
MKIIVSTKKTQGQRKNDFSWVPEGEILTFGFECDGEIVDGSCGCKRSLCGVDCLKATTTMRIIDSPITKKEYIEKQKQSLVKGGWFSENPAERDKWAKINAEELLKIANAFPVTSIIEKRGNTYKQRCYHELKK